MKKHRDATTKSAMNINGSFVSFATKCNELMSADLILSAKCEKMVKLCCLKEWVLVTNAVLETKPSGTPPSLQTVALLCYALWHVGVLPDGFAVLLELHGSHFLG